MLDKQIFKTAMTIGLWLAVATAMTLFGLIRLAVTLAG